MTALALVNESNINQDAYSDSIETPLGAIPRHFDEFWTAKQRQMSSLHYSNSYRGSYKPELPEYFISRYTKEIVLMLDADAAGQKAVKRAGEILKSTGLNVRVIVIPEGKAPDEFIKKHGKERFLPC